MRPEIQLTIGPDKHSEYSRVSLVVTITTKDGVEHDVILYDQLRLLQELPETMGIEVWALAQFADTARAIEAALTRMIGEGAITLMAEAQEPRLFLCLRTWSGPSRPAMIDLVPQLTRRGTGSFLWFQPRSCE